MSIGSRTMAPETRRSLVLWATTFGPPIAWFAQLVIVYALTPLACSLKNPLLLHLVSFACLFVAALGAGLALAEWTAVGRGSATDMPDPSVSRPRFQALVGILSGGFFSLVVVAEWLAITVLNPCVP